ncbi:MAG: formate/nitrite transporter family protein [Gammaproteobacteria bacterium]
MPDTNWSPQISKHGYSVVFKIHNLGRQQLYTENTLTPVVHVLRDQRLSVFASALRLWAVVLAANLLGTLIFGIGLYLADVFEPTQTAALLAVSDHAVGGEFQRTFLSAVLAGWLIALMVWLLPAAETARVGVIIIITYLVGLGGFSHIIAGSAVAAYALAAQTTTLWQVFAGFFVPTLAGNVVGGVAFVAALNYAQVVPED